MCCRTTDGSNNGDVDMRSENEMYNLILEIAKNNVRIKVVYPKFPTQNYTLLSKL